MNTNKFASFDWGEKKAEHDDEGENVCTGDVEGLFLSIFQMPCSLSVYLLSREEYLT